MSRRIPRTTLAAIVVGLMLTGCSAGVVSAPSDTPSTGQADRRNQTDRSRARPASNALVRFDACDTFLDYVISHGLDLVGPYGLADPFFDGRFGWAVEEATDGGAQRAASPDAGTVDYSGTNVQVLGVDEPDMVKTDGGRIVVLAEGTLIVTDVTGPKPVVIGRYEPKERVY